MRLTGYADKFGVHPGDKIKFFVNCDGPKKYKAEIVKMINGDTNPRGPGFIEKPISVSVNAEYPGRKQVVHSGSYAYVLDNPRFKLESFTLQCWIWPTTPKTHPKYWKHGPQGLVTKWSAAEGGYGLFINEAGCAELRVNGAKVATSAPLRDHAWHFLAATFDAKTGEAVLYHEPQITYALDPEIEPVKATLKEKISNSGIPCVIAGFVGDSAGGTLAASSVPKGMVIAGHYNGKIDSPRICNRALSRLEIETMKLGAQTGLDERRGSGPTPKLSECIVAAWDFSVGINTIVATDKGPYLHHASIVNCPTRAMTGYNWSGHDFDWKHAESQYGAIHFH
ncbi:MAG: N,N-dimethylformamidase large subunit, partial [Methyloversatilis sp. 12-65-5]